MGELKITEGEDGSISYSGSIKEFGEHARRRCAESPGDLLSRMSLAIHLYVDRQFEEAVAEANKILGSDDLPLKPVSRESAAAKVLEVLIAMVPVVESKFLEKYAGSAEAARAGVMQQQSLIDSFRESECQ